MEPSAGFSIGAKILAAIAPRLVGRYYSEVRIANLLDVQPMGTNECVVLQHSSRSAYCWLAFTNLSPFTFTIDRAEVRLNADGVNATLYRLMPEKLKTTEKKNIYADGIFDCSAECLALAKKATQVRIEVRAFIVSDAKNFQVTRYFDQVKNFRISG